MDEIYLAACDNEAVNKKIAEGNCFHRWIDFYLHCRLNQAFIGFFSSFASLFLYRRSAQHCEKNGEDKKNGFHGLPMHAFIVVALFGST